MAAGRVPEQSSAGGADACRRSSRSQAQGRGGAARGSSEGGGQKQRRRCGCAGLRRRREGRREGRRGMPARGLRLLEAAGNDIACGRVGARLRTPCSSGRACAPPCSPAELFYARRPSATTVTSRQCAVRHDEDLKLRRARVHHQRQRGPASARMADPEEEAVRQRHSSLCCSTS